MPKYTVQMLTKHGDVTGMRKKLVADDENQAIESFISCVEEKQSDILRREAHKIRVIEGRVKRDFENPKLEAKPSSKRDDQLPTQAELLRAQANQATMFAMVSVIFGMIAIAAWIFVMMNN